MMRNARYTTLDGEDTAYSHNQELTNLNERTTFEPWPLGKPSGYDHTIGNRLQRFYPRTLVGIFGPSAICAYYAVIWRLYITPNGSSEPILVGHHGAKYVYYSWFVVGVLGLSLSLYGLAGVEAGMLMEPAWDVGDGTSLMLHANKTWSGPGGWLKTVKWAVGIRGSNRSRLPSWLWFALAVPSILVFVAIAVSGLTMEITPGYRRTHAAVPATMWGFSWKTFNERDTLDSYTAAANSWVNGQDERVPGAGIVYTPEGVARSESAFLSKIPVVFPKDDNVTTIFLAAQANQPTEGRNWGVLLQYGCSVVTQARDFRLINRTMLPMNDELVKFNSSPPIDSDSALDHGSTYLVKWNQTDRKNLGNLDAVAVFGLEVGKEYGWDWYDIHNTSELTNQCYFRRQGNSTVDYPGINHHQAFEVVVWQRFEEMFLADKKDLNLKYNHSIDHAIEEFFGAYETRDWRSRSREDVQKSDLLPMKAVGVRCNASSSVGSADINSIRSTFSNFKRTDTHMPDSYDRCAARFESKVPLRLMMSGKWADWFSALLTASAAPRSYYGTYDKPEKNGSTTPWTFNYQLGYLQASQLRRAMLHAYASYAVQLMYFGGQTYTTNNGSQSTFTNENVTALEPGSVIKPGVVPAIFPATLFCIWALISSSLCIIYGFRRRWTETLDGHTMFRMGAELSDQERMALLKTSSIGKKKDRVALDTIPALIGDTEPDMWPGRIGLVKHAKANKKRLYA